MNRAAVVIVGVCAIGCSASLEFVDWIIEIPEDTPVREYAPVRMNERDPDAIRLIEELVIGADLSTPDKGVFQPTQVVATDDGTIFVARTTLNETDSRFAVIARYGVSGGESARSSDSRFPHRRGGSVTLFFF